MASSERAQLGLSNAGLPIMLPLLDRLLSPLLLPPSDIPIETNAFKRFLGLAVAPAGTTVDAPRYGDAGDVASKIVTSGPLTEIVRPVRGGEKGKLDISQ